LNNISLPTISSPKESGASLTRRADNTGFETGNSKLSGICNVIHPTYMLRSSTYYFPHHTACIDFCSWYLHNCKNITHISHSGGTVLLQFNVIYVAHSTACCVAILDIPEKRCGVMTKVTRCGGGVPLHVI